MRWAPTAIVLAACYAPHARPGAPCSAGGACPAPLVCAPTNTCELGGAASADAPGGTDGAPPDGSSASPDTAPLCFGTGPVTVCVDHPPMGTLDLSTDTAIDTAAGAPCDPTASSTTDACFVVARTIRVEPGVTLAATGARPLVLVASKALVVDGTVDVASRRSPAQVGAGAGPATCGAGIAPAPGGGGAGGTAGGPGGDGGAAASGSGAGGVAAPVVPATALAGGCPGQAAESGGAGGLGGGAVALLAGGTLTITGVVDASGEGGAGGMSTMMPVGGGGGGAGGMIVLDAPMVSVLDSAQVYANGGGGGAPGLVTTSAGQDPSDASTPAAGGKTPSATGGAGAALSALAGAAGTNGLYGGAGGGGGAGVVHVTPAAATVNGVISPPPT